jgi:selenide,water dikinase
VQLLLRGDSLSLGSAGANRRGLLLLQQAGVTLTPRASAAMEADLACTGSRAPAWLAASGLPVQAASGRVLTDASLMVQGHPALFACGDCALIATDPRPPSGVWAVRAAPVLAENLRRSLGEAAAPLRRWRPQRLALQLLAAAPAPGEVPRALALFGPWQLGPSRWLWHWKDRIDRRFMAGFNPAGAMGTAAADDGTAMVCRGCAAKLPAAPLSAALARVHGGGSAPAAVDAAVVATMADGLQLLQSVDGFPALVDDPWLNARLTTLHACSDLWACGAAVQSAQVLITLPQAAPPLQEDLLVQSLEGVRSVLDGLAAPLLGGHTLEGRDGAGLSLALTVNGVVQPDQHWPKGPLQPGQVLLITRAIGSGVLFAAAMAGAAPAAWIEAALAVMQQDQSAAVGLLARHGCRACTDVTGFGLLGHLGEMLGPGLRVELQAGAIPTHVGALPLLAQGVASSLAPANARALALLAEAGPVQLQGVADSERRAIEALLIDPQTCGPLLAALPADQAQAALRALRDGGFPSAALIGRICAA